MKKLLLVMILSACGPGLSKDALKAKATLEDVGFTKVEITDDSDYTACPITYKPGITFSALDRNGTPCTGVVCCTPSDKCNIRWDY